MENLSKNVTSALRCGKRMRYGYAFYNKCLYRHFKFVCGISLYRYPFYIGSKPFKGLAVVRKITKRNYRRILKPYMYRDNYVYFS